MDIRASSSNNSTIPYKDTQVSLATEEFRGTFEESFYELSDQFSLDIWAYFGIAPWQGGMPGILPIWWDEDKGAFQP